MVRTEEKWYFELHQYFPPQFLLQLMNLASFSTRFSFSSIYQGFVWSLCSALSTVLAAVEGRVGEAGFVILKGLVKFRESMFLPLPYVKVTLRVPVPAASCDSQTHERPDFSSSPWGHAHPSQPPTWSYAGKASRTLTTLSGPQWAPPPTISLESLEIHGFASGWKRGGGVFQRWFPKLCTEAGTGQVDWDSSSNGPVWPASP